MKTAVEGILYPLDACSKIGPLVTSEGKVKPYSIVPHAAWSICKAQLDMTFSTLMDIKPGRILVLAPLHKGPVGRQDKQVVYTPQNGNLIGTDWQIKLEIPDSIKNYVQISDDGKY
ncbi:MAG: hypothetical protein HUK24_02970, partial [Sphaerochaetaceae bacterium]|nr:hypothetical protein [Sphaerochaetaceae bacterium]